MMRSLALAFASAGLAGSALLWVASPVGAQVLKNHDTNAPVNFAADRIEVQDRADRVVVSGNVHVTQAGLTLDAARMTVAYTNTNAIEINRIDASGGVTVRKSNETARGNVAIYDLDRRLITMIGDVTLTQGSNNLTGGRLVIDLASGRSTIDGRSSAPSVPGAVSSGNGRVTGQFTVPQRNQ